jgi:S1-C subfamily serine protease
MVRHLVAIATWGIVALCSSNSFAAGPLGSIHIENWKGGAYTNDSTGAFSHCAAGKDFNNGVGIILSENAQHGWVFALTSAGWSLVPGTSYTMDLTFDGQAQFRVFGKALNANAIVAPIPEPAINRLHKSHLLVVSGTEQTLQFILGTVERLPASISTCVDKMNAGGIASADNFSAPPPKPPVVPTASKSADVPPETSGAKLKLTDVNGTGFIISTSGHVLTNNHVIGRCVGDVSGNLTGAPVAKLRVVSTDETNDLALLQIDGSFKDPARIRASAVHSGDSVVAIGFPLHGLLTSDFTVTTGIVNSLSGIINDTRYLQISAPIQPGNSGGPLLDNSGNVIGVVSEKLNALRFAKLTGDIPQNINFAIKTGAVRDFLDNSVVPYQTSETGADVKTAQIAESARKFTMLISCKAEEIAKKER